MKIAKRRLPLSSKIIALSSLLGLCLSGALGLAISSRVAQLVSDEAQNRIIDIVFDAIASGPLVFARMQSSAIADEQLSRLMATRGLRERGVSAVEIKSGEAASSTYASWRASLPLNADCRATIERRFEFKDSMYPFKVTLTQDRCATFAERRRIFLYSATAALSVLIIAALILFCVFWPMFSSVSTAEKLLDGTSDVELESIWLDSIRSLVIHAQKVTQVERYAAQAEIAAQVSHDIRAPLSALNMMVTALTDVPSEKKDIIARATKRINEIANDLLSSKRAEQLSSAKSVDKIFEKNRSRAIFSVLENIVAEKKAQYSKEVSKRLRLDGNGPVTARAFINEKELARAISNLIDNSIEATGQEGQISIAVRSSLKDLSIVISDDGCGIPTEVLQVIGSKPVSSGKTNESGSGLGFYHAKKAVEEMGGKLTILSREGVGTMITMTFRRDDSSESA